MQTPAGPIRFLTTFELEPTADGTLIQMRFCAPTSKKERAIFEQVGAMFAPLFEANAGVLRSQLAAELEERVGEGPREPDVPTPSPSAPFAGIRPLELVG